MPAQIAWVSQPLISATFQSVIPMRHHLTVLPHSAPNTALVNYCATCLFWLFEHLIRVNAPKRRPPSFALRGVYSRFLIIVKYVYKFMALHWLWREKIGYRCKKNRGLENWKSGNPLKFRGFQQECSKDGLGETDAGAICKAACQNSKASISSGTTSTGERR